ncbi:MAG: hypothetical protein JSS60_07015 [Verrucomicrobia bacterium]|nr:hypothetical protein [Verrucomicrobiota bacterium]
MKCRLPELDAVRWDYSAEVLADNLKGLNDKSACSDLQELYQQYLQFLHDSDLNM